MRAGYDDRGDGTGGFCSCADTGAVDAAADVVVVVVVVVSVAPPSVGCRGRRA